MGFKKLREYIRNHNDSYSEEVSTINGKIKVVIDGSALYHGFYHSIAKKRYRNALSVGNIKRNVYPFLDKLKENNIEIAAIFIDGMDDQEKVKTYQIRRNDKMKSNKKLYDNDFEIKSHPSMILWFRYIFFELIRQYYNKNIKLFHSGLDADNEIAKYANDNNCYIMSDDSDMFVLAEKGMIFIQDCKKIIRHPEMKLRYYSRKLFMQKHKINYSQLLYLGILNGNDFIESTSLRRVFHLEEDEKQTFDHSLQYLESIKDHCKTEEDLYDDYCKLHPHKQEPRKIIKEAFDKYRLNRLPKYPYNYFTKIHSDYELEEQIGINEKTLRNIFKGFDRVISSRINNFIFSPIRNNPLFLSFIYQTQFEELVFEINDRIYSLLEDGETFPYVICTDSVLKYYPSKEAWDERINNPNPYIKKHIEKLLELQALSKYDKIGKIREILPYYQYREIEDLFIQGVLTIIGEFLKRAGFPVKKVRLYINVLKQLLIHKKVIHINHSQVKNEIDKCDMKDGMIVLDALCSAHIIMSVIANIFKIKVNTDLLDNYCFYCVIYEAHYLDKNVYHINLPQEEKKDSGIVEVVKEPVDVAEVVNEPVDVAEVVNESNDNDVIEAINESDDNDVIEAIDDSEESSYYDDEPEEEEIEESNN